MAEATERANGRIEVIAGSMFSGKTERLIARLRADALAVRLGVPAIKVPGGLAPPSQTPCRAHENERSHPYRMAPAKTLVLPAAPSRNVA